MLKPVLPLVFLFLWTTGSLFAQDVHLPPSVRQGPTTSNVPVRTEEEVDRERVKKAYEVLQVEIKRDTEKLFQLTGELKEAVDKSDQGILPADTLKKAEQIEKLAHSVKSKIKQTY
ncbi:MAG: hypothetical protein ACRD20_15055 [Terriglobales bacterium]